MTIPKIKLCGLTRLCDIDAVNALLPEYIGFVFAKKSRRYIPPEKAAELKERLDKKISAVGVFVNEKPQVTADMLRAGIIDMAQLHGGEDEDYVKELKALAQKPVIKAFRMDSAHDVQAAEASAADFVLLDRGSGGTGEAFDWSLARELHRPYFLAGGLNLGNIERAVTELAPYAVDVSSGIETNGVKDIGKMREFVRIVREKGNNRE